MRIFDDVRPLGDILVQQGVFFYRARHVHIHDIAGGELGVCGFEHFADGAVGDGLAEGIGRGVRFYVGSTHAAALVGVEGEVEVFGEEAIFGGLGGFQVDRTVFDGEVLPGLGPARRNFFEDEGFVLDHDCGVWCCEKGYVSGIQLSLDGQTRSN